MGGAQALLGKSWTCAVANHALQPLTILGRDPDACVQAESAAVVLGEHLIGLMGFEDAAGTGVAQKHCPDALLHVRHSLAIETLGTKKAPAARAAGRAHPGAGRRAGSVAA